MVNTTSLFLQSGIFVHLACLQQAVKSGRYGVIDGVDISGEWIIGEAGFPESGRQLVGLPSQPQDIYHAEEQDGLLPTHRRISDLVEISTWDGSAAATPDPAVRWISSAPS